MLRTRTMARTSVTKLQLAWYGAVGALIGKLLLDVPLIYIVAVLGTIVVSLCTLYKPELSIIAMVVLIASVLDVNDLPLIPLGVGSFTPPDVLLLIMMPMVVRKRLSETSQASARSPVSTALALFLAASFVSAVISIVHLGLDFNAVLRLFRVVSYYVLYYVTTNLIVTKKQIRFLINGLFAVAVAVALIMIVQLGIGDSIQLLPGKQALVNDLGGGLDAIRLQPPGQTLLFVTFMTAVAFVVIQRGTSFLCSRYLYLVIVLGLGVVLTYVRTYLLAASLGLILLLFLGTPENRRRLLVILAWGTVMVCLFAAVSLKMGGKLESTVNAVSGRYLTLFQGKELVQSSSLDDRGVENSYAIAEIKNSPLLGIGLGNDYRPPIYGRDDEMLYYVHNGYLWLPMDMGIPVFCLFLWFYFAFLVRALRNLRRIQDEYLKSIATGATIAGVAMLPMALVIPLFMEWHSIVVMVIFIGLTETIVRNPQLQDVG